MSYGPVLLRFRDLRRQRLKKNIWDTVPEPKYLSTNGPGSTKRQTRHNGPKGYVLEVHALLATPVCPVPGF